MINWYSLAANSLWIFAVALAFSVLSIARWEAVTQGEILQETLKSSRWQIPLHISSVFFCAGLAATSDLLWERILWIILLIWMIIQIGLLVFSKGLPISNGNDI
jgi:predicted lysophospholipase L1 biosynthesis ABC-type transport system permease subunit